MIIEKAQEIGRLIGQSDEYRALKRSHEDVRDQNELQEKMNQLSELAQKMEQATQAGTEPPEEQVNEYGTLLSTIQGDPRYQQVVSAQSNFDKLMVKVNEEILEGIKQGAASPIITLG